MEAVTDTTETAARFAQSIASLPPLPATAQEILTCFGDEFIDAKKVTSVVEGDPGICAKLLGLANSAYFGLAEPVNRIEEAISRVLGVDTVRSLVLAMAIQQTFNSQGCPTFNTERFWIRCLMVAECCKRIAIADEAADEAVRDLAYSAGLCHNLGLLALAHLDASRTDLALKKHRNEDRAGTLAGMLQEQFDTDHKILTAELGRIWSLPAPMVSAYQYRAFPESHCGDRLGLVLAAGVIAVKNSNAKEEHRSDIAPIAATLGLPVDDLVEMSQFQDWQRDRVHSLANNMTR